jgi:hypothetical protein
MVVFPTLGLGNICRVAFRLEPVARPAERAQIVVAVIAADLQRNVVVKIEPAFIGRLKAHLARLVEALPDCAANGVGTAASHAVNLISARAVALWLDHS